MRMCLRNLFCGNDCNWILILIIILLLVDDNGCNNNSNGCGCC